MNISNKVAVVSGGASGLGLATSQRLLAEGAKVLVLDLNEDAGQTLAAEYPDKVLFIRTDVTDAQAVEQAIGAAVEQWQRLDICVNCAGIVAAGKVLGRDGALPLTQFSNAIDINLNGTFNVLRVAASHMASGAAGDDSEESEKGVIINTASVAAFDGQSGQAAYSASKAAIAGMTLPIARDLAPHNIRVMTIAPGLFDTPMMKSLPEKVRAPLIEMVQSPKRFGLPEEFADLCCHIIGNPYLNGEVIRLDAAIRMEPK